MSWSFGEVRALSIKAARGAGMPWGLAEEAGFAVVWLEELGAPGVQALAIYLSEIGEYTADTCPIAIGSRISDSGSRSNIFPRKAYQPIFFAPFLSSVLGSASVELRWSNCAYTLNSVGFGGVQVEHVLSNGVHLCEMRENILTTLSTHKKTRVTEDRNEPIQLLESFAKKTYAPATEESRTRGAGAGLSDND